MPKNFTVLLRMKVLKLSTILRILYFKTCGLKVGEETVIGKIVCDWPNKIIIGRDSVIEDGVVFKITKPFTTDNLITLGNGVFVGNGCEFNCNTTIVIGDNCLIASRCTFVDTGHEIDPNVNINKQPLTIAPILLEEDVWIGTQSVILKGVKIGKGSIVGAGSVVNKSIPAYEIWAGSPARFIRKRE